MGSTSKINREMICISASTPAGLVAAFRGMPLVLPGTQYGEYHISDAGQIS